ncbi:YtxH domain-containing protein [Paenibacillus sp. FSL L8-0436]|uniref:YtxH domain-containing protein n=1 Tax=Paenibacillus sp. FSL L8-0436 TaxID=2954686 RepID=UPI00315938A3
MKKESKSLLWGILAGSVVGSVTALLFAPKPGKELRKDIAEGTTGAIDKVQDVAGQAGDKGAELYGKAKEAVETVVTEVKEWSKQYIHADEEEKYITLSGKAVEEAEAVSDAAEAAFEEAAAGSDESAAEIEDVLEDEVKDDKGNGEIA